MEWYELTKMTNGAKVLVERVRIEDKDVAIEGSFELPPLANLSAEDQVFVAAFVRCHGSIKQMEQTFGVSYPTIKSRLNRIGNELKFVEVASPVSQDEVLAKLDRGEVSVEEALEMMRR
ncbi:DUF2089 domain-containing protein [bacterium]|nr:DUF2089 domain-containing protein [bacterium]